MECDKLGENDDETMLVISEAPASFFKKGKPYYVSNQEVSLFYL